MKDVHFRSFKHGIFLQNERGSWGSNDAHIVGNTFEDIIIASTEIGINISRNNASSRDRASILGNVFDMFQFQAGWGSSWGGEKISVHFLVADGSHNTFTNWMCWDAHKLRYMEDRSLECSEVGGTTCVTVIFNTDAKNNFIKGNCGLASINWYNAELRNYGTNNTRLSTDFSYLFINSTSPQG